MELQPIGYEIDFLPVGNGDKSGDAIAVRYGTHGNYTIHVVDGGTLDSGTALVEHINNNYDEPGFIDHVVCTHPDGDHASGLRRILENFQVGNLWMNRPWLYAEEILPYFKDQRITAESLRERLRGHYPYIDLLEKLALENEVTIHEAFQGQKIGAFIVLSPTKDFYKSMVLESAKTPDTHLIANDRSVKNAILKFLEAGLNWLHENWQTETLKEGGKTSTENETSIVQIAEFGDRRVLLTGDAGLRALNEAANIVEELVGSIPPLRFIQIPHHGSRNNVGPEILNRWLGPPVSEGEKQNITAFVSASKESSTHPRKAVLNAFIRRGTRVISTKGDNIWHSHNMPGRTGWSSATVEEFSTSVEPYTTLSPQATSEYLSK